MGFCCCCWFFCFVLFFFGGGGDFVLGLLLLLLLLVFFLGGGGGCLLLVFLLLFFLFFFSSLEHQQSYRLEPPHKTRPMVSAARLKDVQMFSLLAQRPSTCKVLLRDGFARTLVCAATLRQILPIELAISPGHRKQTSFQPVLALIG